MDPITLALANQYTAETAEGMGAVKGKDGKDGKDGVSPTVTTTPIDGGTKVTITDASGPHSFDVMDGKDGTDSGDVTGGMPYVDLLVAPSNQYTSHNYEVLLNKPLSYSTESGDPPKVFGTLENGKEFAAYFLYDEEPALRYFGIFTCNGYVAGDSYLNATLKNATFVGNETEVLDSFLTFFKLDAVPELNVATRIPFNAAIGLRPHWQNVDHRGFMTVGTQLYLIDFRLNWIIHKDREFQITFKAITPVGGNGGGEQSYLVKSPVGTIVIWSGTADNIPTGWQLCDGTNGTPDLRDKFVLGAGTNHTVGETGGSETVALSISHMPSHNHVIVSSPGGADVSGEAKHAVARFTNTFGDRNVSTNNTGSSHPHPNMPPYYALCYIMKLTADETDGVTMDQVNAAIDTKLNAYEPQEVYSTEETRIGTWIDGKPLYRKVIVLDVKSGLNNNWNISNFGKDSLDIDEIPIIIATAKSKTGGVASLNYANFSATALESVNGAWYFQFNSDSLQISSRGTNAGSQWSEVTISMIIEYTKTTDQAQIASANTILKASSKAPALNAIQSAAVTASGAAEIENIQT